MKQILLIITLFIGLENVNAKDATLEETIEWLEYYGESYTKEYNYFEIFNFECKNEIISNGYSYKSDNRSHVFKINDNKSVKHIILYPYKCETGTCPNIEITGGAGKSYDSVEDKASVRVTFDDIEKATKFYNALKHMYSFYDDCNPTFENKLELENKF